MALMKEILVARNAFAATLTSSAVSRSITSSGAPASSGPRYTSRSLAAAPSDVTPSTMRSGARLSCTAKPSRRNSGFQARSTSSPAGATARIRVITCRAVPTGTVDFPTTRHGAARCGASASAAAKTAPRSARPDSPSGVPTHRKCTSPNAPTSANDMVNRSRPASRFFRSSGSRPGSKNGASPLAAIAIFSASTSIASTSWPRSARQTAWVRPRYPVPMTVTRGNWPSSSWNAPWRFLPTSDSRRRRHDGRHVAIE